MLIFGFGGQGGQGLIRVMLPLECGCGLQKEYVLDGVGMAPGQVPKVVWVHSVPALRARHSFDPSVAHGYILMAYVCLSFHLLMQAGPSMCYVVAYSSFESGSQSRFAPLLSSLEQYRIRIIPKSRIHITCVRVGPV